MDTKPIHFQRRSANITEGKSRAPNRSMYYAMGYEESDFSKPMVGVANGHSTITPCNSAWFCTRLPFIFQLPATSGRREFDAAMLIFPSPACG